MDYVPEQPWVHIELSTAFRRHVGQLPIRVHWPSMLLLGETDKLEDIVGQLVDRNLFHIAACFTAAGRNRLRREPHGLETGINW